jgi:ATP-binding protein involved in chromosome partitioning
MDVVPTDIRQAGPDTLAIRWSDGTQSVYNTRELRLACPCASCHDEVTGERLLDPEQIPADVRPVRIESVGNYGIKIIWTDGHDTGIFSFERLRELS